MKANELRIGNYYQENWIDGDIAQITTKDIQDLIDDPQDDFFYPIKINDEWLFKLGFELKNNWYSIDGMYIRKDGDEFETEIGECLYKNIYYVHQLQNLYFALNDEELTMK